MARSKIQDQSPTSAIEVHDASDAGANYDEKLGNGNDQRGMTRMGKRQELRREFQFFSIWGFAVILGCSWEYVLMSVSDVESHLVTRSLT
jgi:hypothetical protein